jgi:hypothetical protein
LLSARLDVGGLAVDHDHPPSHSLLPNPAALMKPRPTSTASPCRKAVDNPRPDASCLPRSLRTWGAAWRSVGSRRPGETVCFRGMCLVMSSAAESQAVPGACSRYRRARPQSPRDSTLDPQTSAVGPQTSADVQFSLKIWILHLGVFRWTNPNGGQNGGQTHSQAKRGGLIRSRCASPSPVNASTQIAAPRPEPPL